MLTLILGAAGSGKTAQITREISEKVTAHEKGIFMIVPEQYSHEAERELCAVCGDSLSLYAEVLSFSRLAVRVAQEMGTGGKIALDKGGQLLCMTLALRQIAPSLKLYSAAAHRAELQMELLSAINELKAACIGADELLTASEGAEKGLSSKLHDLALCLEGYNAVLARGHADSVDKLTRLAETIGDSSLFNDSHIYIDGFTDFTGAELEVISALIRRSCDITVCLTCDSIDGDSEHFEPSRAAARVLLSLASKSGISSEISAPTFFSHKPAPLRFFEDKLYSYSSEIHDNEDSCISLLRCDSVRAECELAAAKALELVRTRRCRWRDIAVAVRGFDEYSPALSEAFALYGVPLFTARRERILQKTAPALISYAFEVIFGGWDCDAVLAYMKTGLAGLDQDDRDLLEGYAVMWNVRGSAWTRQKPWSEHPRGFAEQFNDTDKELLSKIDSLRRFLASPLNELSRSGKTAKTAQQQAHALYDFLLQIQLPQALAHRSDSLEQQGFALLAAEQVQLWDIIISSLEQFSALLGDTPMTQEEFAKLYLQELSQYDVSAIPISADSVSAGDMDRMRRRHIKHLIILGASDERLPQITSNGGLLSIEERDELSALGIELGGGSDELSRELSLIYNCVTLPSASLTISYCAFDGSGALTRPSFLVNRAKLLFNLEPERFDLQSARLTAMQPAFLLAAEQSNAPASQLARDYFYTTEEGRQRLESLELRTKRQRGSLSQTAVTALYGDKLRLSPSRADAFSSCHFFYFLRYGLKLNENERAGFDPPALGTFMHYVLENVAGDVSRHGGFKNADEELTSTLVDKYTDAYVKDKLGSFEDKSPRFIYLFNRLKPSVRSVACDMVRELSRSDFAPLDFELSFMNGGELPPVELTDGAHALSISGIADRVDGCLHDGKLYLRVIDYKTGKKSFSLSDVYYGMGLQMLLYLFALEREGMQRYGQKIVPAGVLYVPARVPLISAPGNLTDEELSKEREKLRQRSGLILDDENIIQAMEHGDCPQYLPIKYKKDGSISSDSLASSQQLSDIKKHIEKRMLELTEKLSGGSIDASPYYRGEQENACSYCPYGSVCRFDENKDTRRYLPKLKPSEFWEKLEEENE